MSPSVNTEAATRRVRGRPRKYDDSDLPDPAPSGTSQRTRINLSYERRAREVLIDNPFVGGSWFFGLDDDADLPLDDPEAFLKQFFAAKRRGVLIELGRVEAEHGEATMLAYARRVAQLRPTATRAAALVRSWRLGRFPNASADELVALLAEAIHQYSLRHEGLTPDTVRAALGYLQANVAQLFGESTGS